MMNFLLNDHLNMPRLLALAGRSIDNHRGDKVEQGRMILQMLF